MIPFLSEEQGTGLADKNHRLSVIPTKLDTFILEMMPRFSTQEDEYGSVSRSMLFLFAKRESLDSITDGTSAKGRVYKELITGVVRSGQVSEENKRWAQNCVYIDYDLNDLVGPKEALAGRIRVRRLMNGQYGLTIGQSMSLGHSYICTNQERVPRNVKIDRSDEQFENTVIDWYLWNSIKPLLGVEYNRENSVDVDFGVGELVSGTTYSTQVNCSLSKVEYKEQSPVLTDGLGWFQQNLQYEIDPQRIMIEDKSEGLRKKLESMFHAKLQIEFNRGSKNWVPVVKLIPNSNLDCENQSLTFGGGVYVYSAKAPQERLFGMGILGTKYNEAHWWKIGIVEKDGSKMSSLLDGLFDGNGQEEMREQFEEFKKLNATTSRCGIVIMSTSLQRLPGEVAFTDSGYRTEISFPKRGNPESNQEYKVYVTINQSTLRFSSSKGKFWADREYTGELTFEVRDWTEPELKRYVVSGYAPDHALP